MLEKCSSSSVLLEGEFRDPFRKDSADILSGCSTMLKTVAGEMNGIYLEEGSELNYRGITPEQMLSQFRGEAIYTAEVDVHLPKLTVGDTLS